MCTFFLYFFPIFLLDLIIVTINLIQPLTAIFIDMFAPKWARGPHNRDFKIGHYGRLGRLDAYTGGLRP